MQNRYTGDIGDFGKYGLLRFILENTSLRLGINWYLVPDEKYNTDGMKIKYLLDNKYNRINFRDCDAKLYDKLQVIVRLKKQGDKIIGCGCRTVEAIEKSGLFHTETKYYNKPLTFVAKESSASLIDCRERDIFRENWIQEGLRFFNDSDIIFFDPDNGLPVWDEKNQTYRIKKHNPKSIKYVYHDEVMIYHRNHRPQSLIIYNHRDRSPEPEYIRRFYRFNVRPQFFLRWHRSSVRDYIFILHDKHKKLILSRIGEMRRSQWFKALSDRKQPHFSYHTL